MGITLPEFTAVERSLYLTLGGRALDSRASRPFLGDTASAEVAELIGYDLADFPMAPSKTFDIAVRAKRMDEIVARFIRRHSDAVVLDLGVGLDTRIRRVDPPSTVDWYDIDLPAVIDVRRQVMEPRPNVHNIRIDLADPDWLAQIPADRPAVMVADGLIAFLAQDVVESLLHRLTDHFPSGELAFNAYTRFHVWAVRHYKGTDSISDVMANPGFDDPHDVERWEPRLCLVEEILLTRAPEVAMLPPALRLVTRLFGLSRALSRRGTTVLRYQF
ncbi:class I SAM-dependent methyltransferase [Nocardia australiensis]|uniref:class I SAM-dependent methyltransferase n=1 Tax=Nocardia australiensis TaxID=2887191 RepID=UPI001D14AB3A|nr:class I SAM-dependent methyltransferase [Nocardia australiensis]